MDELADEASCDASIDNWDARDCSVSIFFLSWASRTTALACAAAHSRLLVSTLSSRLDRSLLVVA